MHKADGVALQLALAVLSIGVTWLAAALSPEPEFQELRRCIEVGVLLLIACAFIWYYVGALCQMIRAMPAVDWRGGNSQSTLGRPSTWTLPPELAGLELRFEKKTSFRMYLSSDCFNCLPLADAIPPICFVKLLIAQFGTLAGIESCLTLTRKSDSFVEIMWWCFTQCNVGWDLQIERRRFFATNHQRVQTLRGALPDLALKEILKALE